MIRKRFWIIPLSVFLALGIVYKPKLPHLLQKLPFSSLVIGPPKGYVYAKNLSGYKDITYTPIFPSHQITIEGFPLRKEKEETVHFAEDFLLTIKNGRVYGRNAVVITPDDKVLADTAYEWNPSIDSHSIFRKLKFPELHYTDETVAIVGSKGADCIYHWMFEILPRLEILKSSGVAYDKIYLGKMRQRYQKEMLDQLGIDQEKIIWSDSKYHLQAKTLLVPSIGGGISGHMPKWTCDFLREKFLPKEMPLEKGKRIYISRRVAPARKILNEDELFTKLQALGFEEFMLEKLPFKEQVKLFASAEMIVAPHGAGLSHLVFCQPKTKVVEIFCPRHTNPCYWLLSRQMQLEYDCVMGKQENLTEAQQKKNDYTVDVEEVMSFFGEKSSAKVAL